MKTALKLVPLAADHIPTVAAIEKETQGAPWSQKSFEAELTNPHSRFLVGLVGTEIVAYGGTWCVVDECHITNIMVLPEQRRKGYGRQLVTALLEFAQEAGMTCATLEVRANNEPAIRLYEELGFVRAAVRKAYYPDNREDAVIMWLYDLTGWSPQ